MPHRPRITTLCCAAAAAAIVFGGCAGKRPHEPRIAPPAEEPISPVVRGAEAGLEARLWVVQNGGGAIAKALRGFSPPATTSPAAVDLWRRNGFRVLEVPLDRLEPMRQAMPTIGPLHREWLGMLPEWVGVAKGARLGPRQPVDLDNGVAEFGPGRLRLVARCWAAPSVGAMPEGSATGAVLRLEVMPELEMQGQSDPLERLLAGSASAPEPGLEGLAFDRLLLGVVATGGHAIVIVPEDPDLDWNAAAEDRPESIGEARAGELRFGPLPPMTPTLGELMLTSLALPEGVGDARVIVVLVPRVPDRFELLAR